MLLALLVASIAVIIPSTAAPAAAAGGSVCQYLNGRASSPDLTLADDLLLKACDYADMFGNWGSGESRSGDPATWYIDCVHFVSDVFRDTKDKDGRSLSYVIGGQYGYVPDLLTHLPAAGLDTTVADRDTGTITWSDWTDPKGQQQAYLQPGDLIIYKWPAGDGTGAPADYIAAHVAIYMGKDPSGNPKMIQSGDPGGVSETGMVVYDGNVTAGQKPETMLIAAVFRSGLSGVAGGPPPAPPIWPGIPCAKGTAQAGFDFLGNNCPDVLGNDPAGNLWVYPINDHITGRVPMVMPPNSGWSSITKFAEAGNLDSDVNGNADVLAVDKYDTLWLYPGMGPQARGVKPTLGPRVKLASLLGTPVSIVAPGNLNGDPNGSSDVIVETSGGLTTLYRGHKDGQGRYSVDSGTEIARLSDSTEPIVSAGDWNGDGKPDVYVRQGDSLFVLLGTGTRLDTDHPIMVGASGWSQYSELVEPGAFYSAGTPLVANQPREFLIAGRNGVPSGAVAATINLTVANQTHVGRFAVGTNFAAGMDPYKWPSWWVFNFDAGSVPTSASATVGLSPSGTIDLAYLTGSTGSNDSADVIIDVTGYYMPATNGTPATNGSYYFPLQGQAPVRYVDTRAAAIDTTRGPLDLVTRLKNQSPQTFQVASTAPGGTDFPVPFGATAVTGTVIVTNQTNPGFVQVVPGGSWTSSMPYATINFDTGAPRTNDTVVALSTDGKLTVAYRAGGNNQATGTTDLLFDVTGYFMPSSGGNPGGGSTYTPLTTPLALIPQVPPTTLNPGTILPLAVAPTSGAGPMPAGSTAVTGTLTALANASPGGYLTLWPSLSSLPTWWTLNFPAYQCVVSNGVHVPLSTSGGLSVAAGGNPSEVILSLAGYYRPPDAGNPGATFFPMQPTRVADTRSAGSAVLAVDASGNISEVSTGSGQSRLLGGGVSYSHNGPATFPANPNPGGVHEPYYSMAGSLPGVTASTTVSVPFTLNGPGAATVASVDAWVSYSSDGSDWSSWQDAASGSTSPLNLTLGDGDGFYRVFTLAHDANNGHEFKDEADATIQLVTSGGESRVRSFPDAVTPDRSLPILTPVTSNPEFRIPYDYVGFLQPSSVSLWERFTHADGSAGTDWSVVSTKTASFDTPFSMTGSLDGTYDFYTEATWDTADGSGGSETKSSPDASIVLDRTGPTATITNPVRGQQPNDLVIPYSSSQPRAAAGPSFVKFYCRSRTYSSGVSTAWSTWGLCPNQSSPLPPEGSFSFMFPSGRGDYQFYAQATDFLGNAGAAPADSPTSGSGYYTTSYGYATYHGFGSELPNPVRLIDSRNAGGEVTHLQANQPQTFHVSGARTIPADAVGVTGTLTVIGQTAPGSLVIEPEATSSPGWATLNFPVGAGYSSGVTSLLGPGGTLSVVYLAASGTADVIFDVTGYFEPGYGGWKFHSLAGVDAVRLIDSRSGIGGGKQLSAGSFELIQVGGTKYIPSGATAVTGTLTVTGQTGAGFLSLEASATTSPGWSTLNFPASGPYSSGVTLPLSQGGQLGVYYGAAAGSTTNFIFDVTGYFLPDPDTTGSVFVGLDAPSRVVNPRIVAGTPTSLPVATPAGLPSTTIAVTGTLTTTGQKAAGFLSLCSTSNTSPGWSNLNFPTGNNYSTGATSRLAANGSLWIYYFAVSGSTTGVTFDVTGYYGP